MSVETNISFISFLQQPVNKKYALWALSLMVGQFMLFKLLYPYPDFFSDSYSYLFAAYAHLDVSIWPIGYSKFLEYFHRITYFDTALVATQYFMVQLAALHFFFTILYFFQTSKLTRNVLFLFLFVSPLSLYLCNTINSDALFGALSILWFTQLIWIIQRPRIYQILVQAILLFLCFTIRNNAYYYPLIGALSFLLSRQRVWFKLSGIVMPLLLIIPFVIYTQKKALQLTGTRQFSLFTGWQLANNALYIYDQINVDPDEMPTPEAKELNTIATDYFKRVKPDVYRDYLESYVGNFFIRQPEAPLKQYYSKHFHANNQIEGIVYWARASAAFEPFGKTILLHNPIPYLRYFVYPNTFHYFVPPLSHLELYDYGINTVDPIAQFWFRYPTNKIHCFSNSFQGIILFMYMAFFLVFNGYFIWTLIRFIQKRGFKDSVNQVGSIERMTVLFLLVNFGFSIVATVNILRYQFVPMIVILAFALVISDWLEERTRIEKEQNRVPVEEIKPLFQVNKQPVS